MMNTLLDDEWFIPANRNIYDIHEAFKDLDVITWGVKTKNKIGDLIYIYLSAPDSRIGYRCIVEKIDVPLDQALGATYWKYPSKQDSSRSLINIRKIATLPMDEKLTLHYLKSNSLMGVAPQGPRRLDARLSSFLQNF